MIYIDTSVVLAHLLSETERPPNSLWSNLLVSSRLLEYELWTRLNQLGNVATAEAEQALARISFIELNPLVLRRALKPFPIPVRALDALHLASLVFWQERFPNVALATYDRHMREAALRLKLDVMDLA